MFFERFFHLIRNLVRVHNRHLGIHRNVHVGKDLVTYPPSAHLVDTLDTAHMHRGVFNLTDYFGLDAIYHAVPDGDGRVFDNKENGNGDENADHRIDNRIARPHADHSQQNGETPPPESQFGFEVGDHASKSPHRARGRGPALRAR